MDFKDLLPYLAIFLTLFVAIISFFNGSSTRKAALEATTIMKNAMEAQRSEIDKLILEAQKSDEARQRLSQQIKECLAKTTGAEDRAKTAESRALTAETNHTQSIIALSALQTAYNDQKVSLVATQSQIDGLNVTIKQAIVEREALNIKIHALESDRSNLSLRLDEQHREHVREISTLSTGTTTQINDVKRSVSDIQSQVSIAQLLRTQQMDVARAFLVEAGIPADKTEAMLTSGLLTSILAPAVKAYFSGQTQGIPPVAPAATGQETLTAITTVGGAHGTKPLDPSVPAAFEAKSEGAS